MTIFVPFYNVPAGEWIHFFIALSGILLLVTTAETMRLKLGWNPETSRKVVHIVTGLVVLITPRLFTNKMPLIILALIFLFFTILSHL